MWVGEWRGRARAVPGKTVSLKLAGAWLVSASYLGTYSDDRQPTLNRLLDLADTGTRQLFALQRGLVGQFLNK